jgi:hypothetical protein
MFACCSAHGGYAERRAKLRRTNGVQQRRPPSPGVSFRVGLSNMLFILSQEFYHDQKRHVNYRGDDHDNNKPNPTLVKLRKISKYDLAGRHC